MLSKNERSIIKRLKIKGVMKLGNFLEESQQILTAKNESNRKIICTNSEIAKRK